jgi:hypothetical protein
MVGAHVDVAGQQWLTIEPCSLEVEPVARKDEVFGLPAVGAELNVGPYPRDIQVQPERQFNSRDGM